jgi:hypothetical protein
MSAVAQSCTLLYRRFAIGSASRRSSALELPASSRMQFFDTAECNSALRTREISAHAVRHSGYLELRWRLVVFCIIALTVQLSGRTKAASESSIDFQRDVRPILSSHCFKCHGPDEKARKAGLRLDLRESAIAPAKSGGRAIVPGKTEESALARRIFSSDEDEVMPPPETKRPLSSAQKEVLRRWIAAGAEYTPHWAFVPPKQLAPPKVKQTSWPRNAIDYFVLDRLEKEDLLPSLPANKYALARRLHLDLIGLPPTPEEVDAFVNDESAEAYDKLVDKLLASPHYGERWARRWLDLARYADTNGYEKDRRRSIWPYRDWVISAINADMPFDQFTIEQIAGDMLPNSTIEQRTATGFHRNTMLNEEGGIDPLEFRFHATVDRVNTTATAWLGLTMGCAQCHTHKFDPILQQDYYRFMAFLNNADEPELEVVTPEIAVRRMALESQIAALTADLPNRFPPEEIRWHATLPTTSSSAGGATAEKLEDGSVRFSGANPEQDTYTFEFDTEIEKVSAIRLEIFSDPLLPKTGPGRSPEGDAVLTEISVMAAPRSALNEAKAVKLSGAKADFSANNRPVAHAVDGKSDTGWFLRKASNANAIRTASFSLDEPLGSSRGTRWTIRLDQKAGKHQTLGRVRLSFGTRIEDSRPVEVRRQEHLEQQFKAWLQRESARVVRWIPLRPAEAKSNLPLLTVLEDDSVLASGDLTKSDTYELRFQGDLKNISAIRIEALPDDRLPKHGPGRVYYEGSSGDFTLTEFTMSAAGERAPFQRATHSFANGQFTAEAAIDGNPQTGWSIDGGQGRPHSAVFNLASPIENAQDIKIKMLFERHYAAGLGRFRISATTSSRPAEALDLPRDIEELLLRATTEHTPAERQRLLQHFVSVAQELTEARQDIDRLRQQTRQVPTTLVMFERPAQNPRATHVHKRGEFLQPVERVEPDVPGFLHSLPKEAPRNRLTLARWLVDPRNPLVGRVVMNRHWAAFFGTGLVRTIEDFGFQGESPTHPELLDWLAVELINQGWSLKKMHRLIVTSAAYQQSSAVTTQLREKDPLNRLLTRGPRVRLEGELIRDLALRLSGLYAPKLGGPSVFPPQPPGVSTEGAYGPLEWKVSEGEDRYRRGLYTFSKRTAPYAMFTTFDAPTGEACVARREVSNTPLQSLTLLNDTVFIEAAQALGRAVAAQQRDDESRASDLFRRCLSRPPESQELTMLLQFYKSQKQRFESKELDAATIAGGSEGNVNERAAWTAVARALLNLDEVITKS